jgi:hypothetical protein
MMTVDEFIRQAGLKRKGGSHVGDMADKLDSLIYNGTNTSAGRSDGLVRFQTSPSILFKGKHMDTAEFLREIYHLLFALSYREG